MRMPGGPLLRAGMLVLAALLAGCGGGAAATPTITAPSASASRMPPLKDDLAGGTPVPLGSVGHWAISAGRAFVATDRNTLVATDLSTGSTLWRASFGMGKPWESRPTVGISADQSTVVALRAVDAGGVARLDVMLVAAATGRTVAEYLMIDPDRSWTVDLPPRVLAADSDTIVLAADPEVGLQTGVLRVSDGRLVWQVGEQAVAASANTVVTRYAGWARVDGARRWKAAAPLGPLFGQRADVIAVGMDVGQGMVAVWLDPAVGLELARTDELGEPEPACAPASDVLVCLDAGISGYDLANGKRLWSASEVAQSVRIVADWAYLWRPSGRGDVRDARTGDVLAADVELPSIRYADGTGVLIGTDDGYAWVPLTR